MIYQALFFLMYVTKSWLPYKGALTTPLKKRGHFPQMFKRAIFSFQIPILMTLIQPPLKASTTPWILTACCERPSIAWEGNEHHCTGWLQTEGFAIPHCCFCSLNTRQKTFYTHHCKWKEYTWTIKFYVYEGIYAFICKQSLHEPSCCEAEERHCLK